MQELQGFVGHSLFFSAIIENTLQKTFKKAKCHTDWPQKNTPYTFFLEQMLLDSLTECMRSSTANRFLATQTAVRPEERFPSGAKNMQK